MSVGLARIIQDPDASIIVRKALGALSTPGLLVYDKSLSIDDTGRIVIKLKEDGGILEGEDGLYLAPEDIVIGIDSEVELLSQAYDRDWNARLTGSAPNYFEAGLAIGSESFAGVSAGITAAGLTVEDAKVQITAKYTQLRLSFEPANFLAVRVNQAEQTEFYCIGTPSAFTATPQFHIITGDGAGTAAGTGGGLRLNSGSVLQTFYMGGANVNFGGGGVVGTTSWAEVLITITGTITYPQGSTIAAGGPYGAPPAQVLAWSMRMSADNEVAVRLAWFDVMAPWNASWSLSIHKYVG
jgi:hypothetical protein